MGPFWAVAVIGLVGAGGLRLAARARAPYSQVWAALQTIAAGFLCLFSLHIAALSLAGLTYDGVPFPHIYSAPVRLLVILGSLAVVIWTPIAACRRMVDSQGGGFLRAVLVAITALALGAPIAFLLCMPYLVD
jgi:hypothetical protein